MPDSPAPAPALKEMFDAARFRAVADVTKAVYAPFDTRAFLRQALAGLDELSLLQRMRRMAECLHARLPGDYPTALDVLRALAPRLQSGFVTLVLPDYVGLYGREHFAASLEALKFFTPFGSSEFAIREFLRLDLPRTLAVMKTWARDPDEHVRRLASEGCRPRLPWSFRLEPLIADPTPVTEILETLRADPSLYVRKSVANHLNDITKDHPDWVLGRVAGWPRENPHTAWITRHALRTLIKRGHPQALAIIGASRETAVRVHGFRISPTRVQLGDRVAMALEIQSQSTEIQRLVIDFTIHYIKKSGASSAKVFKWKELSLAPGESQTLTRSQVIRDFSTRVHHAGRHRVELTINGTRHAESHFDLTR